jgi:hypothetical protein
MVAWIQPLCDYVSVSNGSDVDECGRVDVNWTWISREWWLSRLAVDKASFDGNSTRSYGSAREAEAASLIQGRGTREVSSRSRVFQAKSRERER